MVLNQFLLSIYKSSQPSMCYSNWGNSLFKVSWHWAEWRATTTRRTRALLLWRRSSSIVVKSLRLRAGSRSAAPVSSDACPCVLHRLVLWTQGRSELSPPHKTESKVDAKPQVTKWGRDKTLNPPYQHNLPLSGDSWIFYYSLYPYPWTLYYEHRYIYSAVVFISWILFYLSYYRLWKINMQEMIDLTFSFHAHCTCAVCSAYPCIVSNKTAPSFFPPFFWYLLLLPTIWT